MKESNNRRNGWLQRMIVAGIVLFTAMSGVEAKPISRTQARQQATRFMQQCGDARRLADVADNQALGCRRMKARGQQQVTNSPYYVFDRGQQEGFIIVAGDDAVAETILGYTDSGTFNYDELPPNMREWLDGYAKEIEQLGSGATGTTGTSGATESQESQWTLEPQWTQQPHRVPHRVPTHPEIKPLLTSKWSQGSPYNDECPMYFTLGRSVTGCVATAYAQILYYHRSKMVTETQAAMPAYDTWTSHATYGHLHVPGIPAGAPLDWDNMIDSYGGSATGLQKKAVAQLMHYCGVAVNMDYTNGSSGAQSSAVADALKKYFGFGNSVQYVYGKSDDEWDQLIYNELSQQRPVYISGADADVGHAFVCDGYDGQRRYHINWGWGGQSDGHYYLSNLTPGEQGIGGSDHGYTNGRECIIGIEPENYQQRTMTFTDATARRLCTEAWDSDGDGHLTYGEAAAVTDLGTVLQGQNIRSLNELRYFTSLQAISDDAFSGCQQLTTVQLPRQLKHIGARAFKDCKRLTTVELPTALTSIGAEAFSGCTVLTLSSLPVGVHALENGTFSDCKALTTLTLPSVLNKLGDEAFSGCTALKELTVSTMDPQAISMGNNVFEGSGAPQAVLHIEQGTRSFFEGHPQWSLFGTIKEHRNRTGGQFTTFAAGAQVYLYHVGSGRFLTRGEAWGTQAVVGTDSPMRFMLRRTSTMPEGTYYLYSNDTGNADRHYLFRTSEDSNVGKGVQAAFVDGNLDKRAHWLLTDVGQDTYTLSVPEGYDGYEAGCRWGVLTDHASQYTQPTWGVYSDIVYEDHEQDCQWRFVAYDADREANYEAAATLENLISMATARRIVCDNEQAVLDDMGSTTDAMRQAQRTLRQKLGLIDFSDDIVRQTCTSRFDLDGDGEISISEAGMINSLGNNFQALAITSFDELRYFTSISQLDGSSFATCNKLTSITLPESVERIYYYAFRGCTKLTSINLPEYVNTIGTGAFSGCTQLKTVSIDNPNPASIDIATDAFAVNIIKTATLLVPVGSKELYEKAPVWCNFGTIVEHRTHTQPRRSPVTEGARGYIVNVRARKMLAAGEAYGTQAVVSRSGALYEWCRTAAMPQGQYYLKNVATGKVVFRVSTDQKVGDGVKACFVDGDVSAKAYWQLDSVAPMTYTLQVPKNGDGYVAGQYLGVDNSHQSSAADYTNGLYWDISYEGHEQHCQWAFITQEDMAAASEADARVDELGELLQRAAAKGNIDAQEEQAAYDNLLSSDDDISQAISSLRRKLHYIDIDDLRARAICLEQWDGDGDGELTTEEAAQVSDIGEVFRNQPQLRSLEVLRHFTGLTAIPDNAFRNATSLATVYVPENVRQVGEMAFTGCPLRFVVLLADDAMVSSAAINGIRSQAQLFVPAALVEAYQADAIWQKNAASAFTGIPVVTALPANRLYGRTNAKLTYEVSGAPIDGEPELVCDVLKEATTPVGDYAISVTPGTITSEGLICQDGILTITPAELTITAKSYTRAMGEDNPVFEFTCRGFRNKETDEVLTTQPTITCEATKDSPAGEYAIVISGATAQNYAITFVNGVLTVQEPSAITGVKADQQATELYDMQGRRVATDRRGLYIDRTKRRVVRR